MKYYINVLSACFLASLVLMTACKKDNYRDDGGKSNPNVNMTTYDFLKSDTSFSMLVHLIDRAGLKDMVNGNITFFAVTNYGVADYLTAKKNQRAIELNNENITYTLDSIPLWRLDSLKTYMFSGKIDRKALTTNGAMFTSLFGSPGLQYELKLTRQYGNPYIDYVDFITYIKVVGTRDDLEPDLSLIPKSQLDQASLCQTSGIITTTGIVHVLDGYHRLFFNTENIN